MGSDTTSPEGKIAVRRTAQRAVPTISLKENISMLHEFGRVAKRARAANLRNGFERAQAFRHARCATENKHAPQLNPT